jgi:hypothetical protein
MLLLTLWLSLSPVALSVTSPVSTQWWVLGPFVIGEREHGADPTFDPIISNANGVFGMFSNDQQAPFEPLNVNQSFPSELVDGGYTQWMSANGSVQTADDVVSASVNIQFPHVNWPFIENPIGSAGAMFQGWAVTELQVDPTDDLGVFLIHCSGAGVMYVDDPDRKVYGDPYQNGYAWFPAQTNSKLSRHYLYVKLSGFETSSFTCEFKKSDSAILIHDSNNVAMDIVDSALAGDLISISLINAHPQKWLSGVEVSTSTPGFSVEVVADHFTNDVEIAPFQPKPVTLAIHMDSSVSVINLTKITVDLDVSATLVSKGRESKVQSQLLTISAQTYVDLYVRTWDMPFKFTFVDFDHSVHYTSVWTPKQKCPEQGCPVLLSTHGAGVDSDEIRNPAWAYAYERQTAAWILLPLGRRRYGYDWQGAGRVNALKALSALKKRYGSAVDDKRILFAGHSMGGHGCWHLSGLYADTALAAAPAAGWIRYQMYSPYFTRPSYDYIDPSVLGLLESSLGEADTALHITNLKGIDLIVRMGQNDDNVPPYEMRRMARLQMMQGGNAQISEVPGEGHWFNGVVDDATMQGFFESHLYSELPALPSSFIFTCVNLGACGTRGGFRMLQSAITFKVSKIRVVIQQDSWIVTTSNLLRLTLESIPQHKNQLAGRIQLDSHSIFNSSDLIGAEVCRRTVYDNWRMCNDDRNWVAHQRSPFTYGPIRTALLNKIIVVFGTHGSSSQNAAMYSEALWFSNMWYYQGRGVMTLVSDVEYEKRVAEFVDEAGRDPHSTYNLVLIGSPSFNSVTRSLSLHWKVPVSFQEKSQQRKHLRLTKADQTTNFYVGKKLFVEPGTGVLFLAPNPVFPGRGLMAVIGGTDFQGIKNAASLFPHKSGETLPDWIVVSPQTPWTGYGSTIGAGFWSNKWDIQDEMTYLI